MKRASLALALATLVGACTNRCPSPAVITPTSANLTYVAKPSAWTCEDDFTWQNMSQGATIQFAMTALTSGSVEVTMLDANGHIVRGTPVADDGGIVSDASGSPGSWSVEVVYTGASGMVQMVATPVSTSD